MAACATISQMFCWNCFFLHDFAWKLNDTTFQNFVMELLVDCCVDSHDPENPLDTHDVMPV